MAERRDRPGRHGGVILLLTVLGSLLLGVSAEEKVIKKKIGDDVILVPKYTGDPSEINWKIGVNKLVDMELKPKVDITFYHLQDRATISETDGSLTIRDLTIGDSDLYTAEAVNGVNQNTPIRLIVLPCPADPTISEQKMKDRIVLRCESSTEKVTYEWQNNGKSVGTNRLYNESQPKEDVTLTCVVDNEVCKTNASITIPYTPETSGLSGGIIAVIVILVLFLIIIIIILLLIIWCCRNYKHRRVRRCIERVQSVFPRCKEKRVVDFVRRVRNSFSFCKGNATDEERPLLRAHSQQVKLMGSDVTLVPEYNGDPSEINWKIGGNKLVEMKLNHQEDITFYCLQDRVTIDRTNGSLTIKDLTVEDSGVYTAETLVNGVYQNTEITLTVRESCSCITVKFPTEDQQNGIRNPSLIVHNVKPEDRGHYIVEVLQSDGQKHEYDLTIKEEERAVIIRPEGDRVTLTVSDTEKVTKITWKKGGVTLFQWRVSSLKLHTNNISLEPGLVTVKNAEGKESYKVEVHITNNTFQLKANNQDNESPTNTKASEKVETAPPTENANNQDNESPTNTKASEEVKTAPPTENANNQDNESPTNTKASEEVKTAPPTENGVLESQPITSVTFHPINTTNKAPIWKKDGQPVNTRGDRIKPGPYGDLTINKVMSDDEGKYTVQCEDQKLEQEFIFGCKAGRTSHED